MTVLNTHGIRIMKEREAGQVAVIGGGASGCLAAIAAARAGCTVFLLEKNEKIGKKLYATGNGKCNLTNLHIDGTCYHSSSGDLCGSRVMEMLEHFSRDDLIRFFSDLGVPVHERDGYVYPRTDQAETVVRALEKCMRNLGVHVMTGTKVCSIGKTEESGLFRISYESSVPSDSLPAAKASHAAASAGSKREKEIFSNRTQGNKAVSGKNQGKESFSGRNRGKKNFSGSRREEKRRGQAPMAGEKLLQGMIDCDCVILCTGGLAGPSFGCDGDGYGMARGFSHHVTPLYPALTQLVCDCPWLKRAAGARCHASVCLVDSRGNMIGSTLEDGEVQMTDYGISGIPVFQISGRAARILDRGEALYARIDFLPEFTQEQFKKETAARLLENRDQMLSDLLLGLAHRKVIDFLLASEGLQAEMKARRLSDEELAGLIRKLRAFDLRVTNVRSFENAQVTCGGVPLSEVSDGFESVCCPGLYLAGELLDVDGRCGGYNLQWAMSSGYQAGSAAAQYSQRKLL